MKKCFFIFIIFHIFLNNLFTKEYSTEEYYETAIKFYLDGELDNALNVLIRALQKDKNNVKYSTLYDTILEEKSKLKIIKLENISNKRIYNDSLNYSDILLEIKRYVNKKEQQQNQRVLNIIEAISKENQELKEYQKKIIDKKINENENNINKISNNLKYLLFLLLIMLFILLFFIILFFAYLNKIKKITENLKILELKQNEQRMFLLKLEEEQKRLIEKTKEL